ncbi:unnamed protein product, partial [Oncorhynchus mykiss]
LFTTPNNIYYTEQYLLYRTIPNNRQFKLFSVLLLNFVSSNNCVCLPFSTEGILNNARDTGVMDTLPLNGNHGNNYSAASGDYLGDGVQILERGGGVGGYSTYGNHKETTTTLEKQILRELTSNYAPSYLNNHQRSATTERNHNLMNKMVNVGNGTGNAGGLVGNGIGGGSNRDYDLSNDGVDVSHMVLDNPNAAFPLDENLGLEIIREESNAPLLPPRPLPPPDSLPHPHPPPPPPHNFSHPRRIPQETSESFFPLLTNEQTDETPQSPNHRNSLYTSMPVLTDLPDGHGNERVSGRRDGRQRGDSGRYQQHRERTGAGGG